MKYYFFLLSAMLFSALTAKAQTDLKPGYVLNTQNDTIKGFVSDRDWSNNPKQLLFKAASAQNAQKITVNNANGFGVNGLSYYHKAVVEITTSPVEISQLKHTIDTTAFTDTVFLKAIVKGKKLSLYQLNTEEKPLYYILDEQTQTVALLKQYVFFNEETNRVTSRNTFLAQLSNLAAALTPNDNKLKGLIERATYDPDVLSEIVLRLNGDKEASKKFEKVSGIRFFAGAGVASTKLSFGGSSAPFSKSVTSTSVSPTLSVGVDILPNKATQKFVVRLEATMATNKFKAEEPFVLEVSNETVNKHLEFKQLSFALVPQIIYNVYSTNKLKAFINAGVGVNIHSYSNYFYRYEYNRANDATREQLDFNLKSFVLSIPLKAGIQIDKNIQIFGGYVFGNNISGRDEWKANVSTIQGGVNYLF